MPVAAVAMVVEGFAATDALVGGLMIASGALSLAGEVTGNKTLSTLGAVAGLGAGVAGLASGGFLGDAAQSTEKSASSSFSSLFTPATTAPADALNAGASVTGDVTPLATGASPTDAPAPGSFGASITDPSQGLLGGNMPRVS